MSHPKKHDPRIGKSGQSGIRKTIPQRQRTSSSALHSRTSQGHEIGSASPSSPQPSKETSASSLVLETHNIKPDLPREHSRLSPQDRHPLRRYDPSLRENKNGGGPWTSSRSESEKDSLPQPSRPRDPQSITQSGSRSTKSETLKSPVQSLLKRPLPPASQYPPPKIKKENSLIENRSDERKLLSSNIEEDKVSTVLEIKTLAKGTFSLMTQLEKLKREETEVSGPKKGALNAQTKTDELEKRILELKRAMNTMVEELEAIHQRMKEKEKLGPGFQLNQQAGKIIGFRPSSHSE